MVTTLPRQTLSAASKGWIFYSIAMVLVCAVAAVAALIGEISLLASMCTPAVAVLIMLLLFPDNVPTNHLWKSLGLWPVGLRAWPVAIVGPFLIFALGLLVLRATGSTTLVWPIFGASAASIAVNILVALTVATVFSLAEEVGWRGYLLPRMGRFGLVRSMLLVGFLHGTWHLPLLLSTDYYHAKGNPLLVVPMFLVTLTLAGIFYGILRLWTGSVWPVAVAHAAVNFAWDISVEVSVTDSLMVREYVGGESGLLMIVGLAVGDAVLLRVFRSGGQLHLDGVVDHDNK